jgi:hypothetical protein
MNFASSSRRYEKNDSRKRMRTRSPVKRETYSEVGSVSISAGPASA